MLYRFENCVLDTSRRELRLGPQSVELEPQVFDLLEFLVRTRDRVVSRDDLLAAVWNGRIVSESTLSSRINAARAAIGDDGTSQRLIKTLPRKGFRFVGVVREDDGADTPAAAPSAARQTLPARPATVEGPAIAVLPFTNMSGDAESDYFADGMAEEIITALARCGGMLVIARNSTFTYKGRAVDVRRVGRELGVGYVLEGSVRRSVDRLRITAQLIEAETGTHLWAERYDGTLGDVFDVQDRIAETAAAIIEPKLRFAEIERARRKPPQSFDAYDLLLKSLAHANEYTAEGMAAAIGCIDRALEVDPSYAHAWATAAFFHGQRFMHERAYQNDAVRSLGSSLAQRALDLGKDDPHVQWLAAFAIWVLGRDATAARDLFRRSLRGNPNSAFALTMAAWIEAVCGNAAEGRPLVERAMRINPLHPHGWMMSMAMALVCIAESNFADAATWAAKAVTQNRHSPVAWQGLVVALSHAGRSDEAKAALHELRAIEPHMTVSTWRASAAGADPAFAATFAEGLRSAGLPE